MTQPRAEVAESDRWDLSRFYENDEAWELDFRNAHGEGQLPSWPELAAFRGRLHESEEVTKEALDCSHAIGRQVSRLFTYAHLRNDEDLANTHCKEMFSRATQLYQAYSEQAAWLEPELLDLPEKQLQSYVESAVLAEYQILLRRHLRRKPHTLPAREEELVAMSGRALGAPSQAFGMLTNADFRFGKIKDKEGREHELTQGSYSVFLRSPDRSLRKNAFQAFHRHYEAFENTLGELLGGQVQGHLFEARAHRFDSCLEAAVFPHNIDPRVYLSLIEAVRKGLGPLHRYTALRKKALGVDELHLYDMYVPLATEADRHVDYEAAVNLVIDSVTPLGSAYKDALATGLKAERWVDRFENQNKRSGAYSSGCYDSDPYILMNYKGKLRDVATLAHEAGHSMHSYLSRKNQPFVYASYPIFVAEVASTFNEEMLTRMLRKDATSKQEEIFLLSEKIEDIRATLYRQTMFAEFELQIHQMAEAGTPLPPSVLKKNYTQLNRDYFGPSVVVDEEIAIEWARIPHFYYNFYVYQYATGIAAAIALSKQVLDGQSSEAQRYLHFLSSGCSKDPLELLQDAGVDMTKPEPVKQAIAHFDDLVTQLETRLDS